MREIAATRGGGGAVHEWAAEAIQSCGQIVELIVCQRLIDGCKPSAYMAAMIKSFRHKGLKALWETSQPPINDPQSSIDAKMHKRILSRLSRLEAALAPEDMKLPGFDFHPLKGHKPKRYTVHVNGPWCITFSFDGGHAHAVDFEQYH